MQIFAVQRVGWETERCCLVTRNIGLDGTWYNEHDVDVERSALHLQHFGEGVQRCLGRAVDAVPGRGARDLMLGFFRNDVGKVFTDILPTTDPTLMIRPLFRAAMEGITALAVRKAAYVLVSKVLLIFSIGRSSKGSTVMVMTFA